jgi:tetratricopeptide (TPR) repeat protein
VYFDLSVRGFAGDADARAFVVKVKPVLGNRGVPTPPVLFMAADGSLLAEVSNYASVAQVLKTMRDVLAKHAPYAEWTAAEKATAGLARASVHIDLLEDTQADAVLTKLKSEQAYYLRGRLARWRGDWEAMAEAFSKVKEKALLDDVRMERAHRHWQDGAYEKLAVALAGFPETSNRLSEARYYEGLAHYHAGRKARALKIWAATIRACAQDPWVYRADWAYCQLNRKRKRGVFSSAGPRVSLLNRIGYMGGSNPDLKAR